MPQHDGTGLIGSGKPGRGFGPCGRFQNSNPSQNLGRRFAQRQFRRRFCQMTDVNQNYIYDYTSEELSNRKKTLEKEMQWLNERIKEIGEND